MTNPTAILVNRNAGKARDVTETVIARIASQSGMVVVETRDADDATRQTARAIRDGGARRIVVLGGDGTINAAVNGMMSVKNPPRDLTLCIIPLGTGNDLARTLAIPLDPDGAIETLDRGRTRAVDLIRVRYETGDFFGHNVAAGGFTGQMNEAMTDQIKRTWGPLAYLRGAMKVVPDLTEYHTSIRYDGKAKERVAALNIIVANGRTAGGGTVVAPRANVEDGLLDVVIVRTGTVAELTGVAARLLAGDYTNSDLVTHRRAKRVHVESTPGMWFNVDGEMITNEPVTFSAVPQALRVIVGAEYSADPD